MPTIFTKFLFYLLLLSWLFACKVSKPPKEKLAPYQLGTTYEFRGDSLWLQLSNPLHCPMRIWVQAKDTLLKSRLAAINPSFSLEIGNIAAEALQFASRFGDTSKRLSLRKVALPFQKHKKYTLMQGYTSTPTHNQAWSNYALDFAMPIWDTVCAATSGYVVGVIEDYKESGPTEEWRSYANSITLYDPSSGLFTQYVHLNYQGSLVELGEQVKEGQKIGISGKTGWLSKEHLHFNCLQPAHSNFGMISIPMDSIGPYRTADLQRNQWIENKP